MNGVLANIRSIGQLNEYIQKCEKVLASPPKADALKKTVEERIAEVEKLKKDIAEKDQMIDKLVAFINDKLKDEEDVEDCVTKKRKAESNQGDTKKAKVANGTVSDEESSDSDEDSDDDKEEEEHEFMGEENDEEGDGNDTSSEIEVVESKSKKDKKKPLNIEWIKKATNKWFNWENTEERGSIAKSSYYKSSLTTILKRARVSDLSEVVELGQNDVRELLKDKEHLNRYLPAFNAFKKWCKCVQQKKYDVGL
jgi:cobalamin biosynthesis protein CobT